MKNSKMRIYVNVFALIVLFGIIAVNAVTSYRENRSNVKELEEKVEILVLK